MHPVSAKYRMDTPHLRPMQRSAMASPTSTLGSGRSRTSPRRSVRQTTTRGGANASGRTRPLSELVIVPSQHGNEDDPFRVMFWEVSPDAFHSDEDDDRVDAILRAIAPQITFPAPLRLQHFRYIRSLVEYSKESVVLFQDAHAKYPALAETYDMPRDHPGYEITFNKPDKTQSKLIMIPFSRFFNFPFTLLLDGRSPPIRIMDVNDTYDLHPVDFVDNHDLRGIHDAIVVDRDVNIWQ